MTIYIVTFNTIESDNHFVAAFDSREAAIESMRTHKHLGMCDSLSLSEVEVFSEPNILRGLEWDEVFRVEGKVSE